MPDAALGDDGGGEAGGTTATSLLASAASGMLARFPCHPLDTAKARLQVQGGGSGGGAPPYRSLLDTLRKTTAREGLKGLYGGFGITVIGSAPATCLYLTSYDAAKRKITSISPFFERREFLAHFMAGMIAEAFSCVLWVPIDVTKERLQVQERGPSNGGGGGRGEEGFRATKYRGSLDAIMTIIRTEGLSGIYRGYGATIASFGPYSAFYFMFYEQIKSKSLPYYFESVKAAGGGGGGEGRGGVMEEEDDDTAAAEEAPFLLHLVNSSVASVMASFVTNPLDLVKLRLQVQRGLSARGVLEGAAATAAAASGGGRGGVRGASGAMPWGEYSGMLDGLVKIARQDGVLGWFRGATARMAFHGPAMAITIASFETLKVKLAV